ncbi:MAG TPA: UDP-N-acetylmuramoyl-L-alanyl-D-glutamate--2,6-diaminopimelate ligase [Coriobacteriia bacterium]|nr:UDP-N-acetylmuramoyl-L-alanyl-D-glutamate--2,6-diaminopimelate ligase [Coriobacteriia bacterium]
MTTIRLSELLQDVNVPDGAAVTGAEVSGIAYRSSRVVTGDAFFCIPGFVHDGHDFAAEAIRRGAAAVVAERPVAGAGDVPVAIVRDTRAALARGAAVFFGHPSRQMRVIGVTGTNGKTTTTYLVESIAAAAGHRTGLIGTVETRIADARVEAVRTTPESADLQALFSKMRAAGVDTAVMEVSSHAIDLHRVDGVRFEVAAFTNLSQDHLDYHHSIEEYYSVKRRLFTELDVAKRVVNVDDVYGAAIAAELDDVLTVGRDEMADVRAVDEEPLPDGTRFTLVTPEWTERIELPLSAGYNVSNALVAAGCALAAGIGRAAVAQGLRRAPQVPGRLERVDAGQDFAVFVDYAHTPDGLAKALRAVSVVTPGRVIAVFGCGGDRDPEKRPLMGAAAARESDHVIITSDNPRSEDPVGIILQIEDGIRDSETPYEVIVDRAEAIGAALARASGGDAVVIAGKGHEDRQVFSDRSIRFDDREVARNALEELCSRLR